MYTRALYQNKKVFSIFPLMFSLIKDLQGNLYIWKHSSFVIPTIQYFLYKTEPEASVISISKNWYGHFQLHICGQ